MSKTLTPIQILSLFAMLAPVVGTTNGETLFQGNRRPGILAAPTEEPTGENALLYRRLGKLRPDEFLDLVSESL